MGKMENDEWLFRLLTEFLEELPLEDKKRFANMTGKDFSYALSMLWGAYLINQRDTGNRTIRPIKGLS